MSQAKVINVSVFTVNDLANYQIVWTFLLSPLTKLEGVSFDLIMSSAEVFCMLMAGQTTGNGSIQIKSCTVIPETDKLGEGSIGVSMVVDSSITGLRMDMIQPAEKVIHLCRL